MSSWETAEDAPDFRGPLDLTRAATAVLDARGTIVGWSPRARDLFGYRAQEVLGAPFARLLPSSADSGTDSAGSLRPYAGVSDVTDTFDVRHKDGHAVHVAVRTCPLPSAEAEAEAAAETEAERPAGDGPATVLLAAEAEEVRGWDTRQALLRALLTESPIGLTVYDARPRVVWANDTCKRELAGPPQQFVGLSPDELVPGGEIVSGHSARTLEEVVQEVMDTGEPVVDLHYRGRPPEAPEHDRVWSYSYYRLLGAREEPLGACEESFDITAGYRAHQRLQLLVEAGEHVGTTLDVQRTVGELAEVVVPRFADSVAIDLLPDVLSGREPRSQPASRRYLVRAESRTAPGGMAVRDVEPPEAGQDAGQDAWQEAEPGGYGQEAESREAGVSPQERSFATGRTVVDNGPSDPSGPSGPSGPSDPSVTTETPAASGARTGHEPRLLVVPLRTRGIAMGQVTFSRSANPDPFVSDELALAEELVKRAAVCVDNARRYTSEHTAALTLQRSLLPQTLPPQTALQTAHRYLPADSRIGVGGDWFDIIPLSGARIGLVVGDVVGHGLRAAATMGRLRTTVRALAQLDLAPDELLTRLDDLVTQAEEERALVDSGGGPGEGSGQGSLLDDETLGVTCLYGIYDPVAQRCSLARAGHLLPAVVSPDGEVGFPELPQGLPLGTGGLAFESAELALPHGSLLALFTDGLVEARDLDIDVGLGTLGDVLTEHEQPLETLCDRVLAMLPSGSATDDAALLLVRTQALSAEQVAVWEMDADPAAVADARTGVGERLQVWGLEELRFSTELIVSELVTNAIRHANGPIHLRLIRDRTLICEVADSGHTSPHLRHAASDDEGGRGLFLIAQTTQRWGTRYTTAGKVIWAEQPLPPSDGSSDGVPTSGS